MSYTVRQKINGKIYLYEVVSYWDKDKKQARQRRKYIGPEKHSEKKNSLKRYSLEQVSAQIIHKNYGNIFLLSKISESLGLTKLLRETFPSKYTDILSLAYFGICSGEAYYLYPHWLSEQYIPDSSVLYSKEISTMMEELGISQKSVMNFSDHWIAMHPNIKSIYYDITSVSSYSVNNNYVEWGHNRDGECLPQINIGIMCSRETGLPLFYQVYPGSIVDVTTLFNTLKYIKLYQIKDVLLVLDRGFCSKNNIKELNGCEGIKFLQPLSFSLKAVKSAIKSVARSIKQAKSAFKYNEEILHYEATELELDDVKYRAHVYYNEKAGVESKHNFLDKLFDIEKKISSEKFNTLKDYFSYKQRNISKEYAQFFKLNKKNMKIERNQRAIARHLQSNGYFIIISNSDEMCKEEILGCYRDRDTVEKLFEVEKNFIDGKRLRAHSKYTADGRIFVKFISLILYSYISGIMSKTKLFDAYSVKEMLSELSKIKYTELEKNDHMISEITKSQKNILNAFNIDFPQVKA